MRPLRLSIEGFACFREQQQLDFVPLELFAISGQTGAGKSTLLDAMIFALYGKVPRVGKNYTECIALGVDRLAVTLDFRVGARSFRVVRVGKRKGAGHAQLEEILEHETKPLADQIRDVDRQVEALLGLGYDAFTQAVVLPQNEFAQFMKSEPRERQQILTALLRVDVYERMRRRAAEIASRLGASVTASERRLQEDYASATPEAVAQLRASLELTAEGNRIRHAEMAQAEQQFEELKRLDGQSQELTAQRRLLEQLAAAAGKIDDAARRCDAARRAAPVLPLLDAAAAAHARSLKAETDRKLQVAAVARACNGEEKAVQQHAIAKQAGSEISGLNKRIRALDELKGTVDGLLAAQGKLAKLADSKKALQKQRDAAARAARDAGRGLTAQQDRVKVLDAAVARIGFDASRGKKLDAWRERTHELTQVRASLAKALTHAETTEQRARKDAQVAATASTRLAAAERSYEASRDAFEAIERELQQAEIEHAAIHLRVGLAVGEPCPVCETPVQKLPSRSRVPKLDALRKRHAAAKQDVSERTEAATDARRQHARAQTAAEKSAEQAAELRGDAQEQTDTVDRLARKLETALASVVGGKPSVAIDERVLAAIQAEAERREQHDEALAAATEAHKQLGALERAAEKANAAVVGFDDRLSSLDAQVAELGGEIESHTTEIRNVTTRSDPMMEREELASRVQRLERELSARDEDVQAARRTVAEQETKLQEMSRHAAELDALASSKRTEADVALRDAGLASDQVARDAILPKAEQRRLELEIEAHRREVHTAQQRVASLERELAGRSIGASEFQATQTNLQRLKSEDEHGLRTEATLEAQLQELVRKLAAANELTTRLEAERREHRQHEQLAGDLRSDRFQEFILREAFADLVARASLRLRALSGRYTLAIHDGDFYVLDLDNAGERRSARTLSGGETFLASLALALELSEQVQRATGAVALDSLFIDEGFGSLDPEALDIAIDAIQCLPQGGRMVGIISHIPEMTARLDARVIVEKRAEGSRLRVEPAGAVTAAA
ncbi:MAG TPA: SMC family ATPase [Kofleriaceae bacterium]|jgi:exonuclease SbcC|nr:SMC family ATPase [Kofleriaceae bacterium]